MPSDHEPTGAELEDSGKRVLEQLGLTCHTHLAHVRFRDINPSGQYSDRDKCEFDYLVPVGEYALLGEITSRTNPAHTLQKYRKFRRAFDAVREAKPARTLWQRLGVPDDALDDFRDVRQVRGFFITSTLTAFDVDLPPVPKIAVFCRNDWEMVSEYAQIIGRFARTSFLHALDVTPAAGSRPVKPVVSVARHKKIVSGKSPTATLYTFEASPYDLLAVASVYRRDALPDLVETGTNKYQRPLLKEKLLNIRKHLLQDPDFIFPSAILGVLSPECSYYEHDKKLELPDKYGSLSVIDGQHRLFSYAADDLRAQLADRARILVTAIQFDSSENIDLRQLSARTFVEINTNQTTVPRTHLDAIAYDVLGRTDPRALAAAVILRLNARRDSKLYGLFRTNQTALGIVLTTTIVGTLKGLVDLPAVARLRSAQRGKPLLRFRGYEQLFGPDFLESVSASTLIDSAVSVLDRYFSHIAGAFRHDWPLNRQRKGSCFENAKFIAAWVRLLKDYVGRGSDWRAVGESLARIKGNVIRLNELNSYTSKVFDLNNPRVPTARYAELDAYRFLVANETRPTAIDAIVNARY